MSKQYHINFNDLPLAAVQEKQMENNSFLWGRQEHEGVERTRLCGILGGGGGTRMTPTSTTFPLSCQCFQTSPLEWKNKIANPKHTDGSIHFAIHDCNPI